ncbi:cell envelope integrity protein TolA [Aquipseudomonas alcaligenes]|uniref:Cell envelope integrity protein TolA n=1 Tax=Aquipseudomonas alcaligenes (strain ATCC 14909 / DSM 50342 / CCUG 1425 / JCM 20561 / NBRC 14159 / NCIMB 9945 / NCTC 10367 / 1577) TaxID=1215092 RepID=U2ZM56_AQUA1|nr:cell envelope integrity protein TolA [Pseudomonas alcaligenes]GAD62575.1 hypothetical protein PA6_013_00450 [Pseudomonas alcaligenes NBRC 14159]SUD18048.1 biopolymer transport protein TolA [Pseudomonas alcaligenes]
MQQKSVRSSSESYFWPTVWAVTIHVLLFAMLFVSFHFAPELPPAKPIVEATLYRMKSQSQATTQTPQKIAGEAQKTKARQYEVEQMETKKEEQKKQEAAEQKKVEAAKQAEAKKAEEAKKAAEQKKLADIAKKKSEEEKKKAAVEEAKKKAYEAEKKKAEAAKKKLAEAEKKRKQQEAARKAANDQKAQALAELLGDTTERQQAQADEVGDQVAGNYDDLIRRYVAQVWNRPPSARNGMSVTVQVNMLPGGLISNVSVVRSSGDVSFDNSAVTAVRSVGQIAEMQGISSSDFAPYRSFKMTFTPEDLDL